MKIPIIILFLFLLSPCFSQVLFNKQYTTGINASVNYMEASKNGYILGGSRLLVIDKKGIVDYEVERNTISAAESINQKGLVLSEHTGSSKIRAYIANYDHNGTLSWEKFYASGHWGNFVFDIVQNKQLGYIYGGRFASVTGSGATITGIDTLGKQQWQVKWNVDARLLTFTKKIKISEADPSQLYVIGTGNGDSKGNGSERDYFITKHQTDSGKRMWTYFPNSDSITDASAILELASDSILVIGNSNKNTSTVGFRGFVSSVSKNKLNWTQEYLSALPEKYYAIEKSPGGGFYILGNRFSISSDSITTFLREINDTGLVIDEFVLHSSGEKHIGVGLVRDSDSVYTVGGRYDYTKTGKGYFLTQFNIENPLDTSKLISTGNFETNKNEVQLFPNPTSGLFTITGLEINETVRIVNYLGVEVHFIVQHENEEARVEIKGEPGVYFIIVESNNGFKNAAFYKIIKQ